jgi:hypothetical protein
MSFMSVIDTRTPLLFDIKLPDPTGGRQGTSSLVIYELSTITPSNTTFGNTSGSDDAAWTQSKHMLILMLYHVSRLNALWYANTQL